MVSDDILMNEKSCRELRQSGRDSSPLGYSGKVARNLVGK